jgi:ABC-type glycerol-3-phosphate transport system substrate-binding protein
MILQTDRRLQALLGFLVVLFALLLAAVAGCGTVPSPPSDVPPQDSTPGPTATTPAGTTPSPLVTPTEPAPSFVTLTIWGPEEFSPGEEDSGRRVLQAQYEAFADQNENIGVEYVLKAPYGESGVLDFLLAASYAAPSALPDIAIVDAFELGPLVRAGLARPLHDLIDDDLRTDLFPFAQEACTFDGDLLGIQFEADIEHLVYYTAALELAPATWADLLTGPISYTFPAGGQDGLVNDAFLIQYMAQGGQLFDEEGKPNLQSSAVQRVLRLYDAVRVWEVSPMRVLDIHNLEECWEAYAEGNITVSHISSWRYLTSRDLMQDTSFAALPTETGEPATMSRGWAFVIITESSHRQAAAARLIEWLMAPQNLAEWSREANHIPTRTSALERTGWPSDYVSFLQTQLHNAFFRPSAQGFDGIARALQGSVVDVLTGARTPRQATNEVMEGFQEPR